MLKRFILNPNRLDYPTQLAQLDTAIATIPKHNQGWIGFHVWASTNAIQTERIWRTTATTPYTPPNKPPHPDMVRVGAIIGTRHNKQTPISVHLNTWYKPQRFEPNPTKENTGP